MLFVLHGTDRVCDGDFRRLPGVTVASNIPVKRTPLCTTVNPPLPTNVCIYHTAPTVCGSSEVQRDTGREGQKLRASPQLQDRWTGSQRLFGYQNCMPPILMTVVNHARTPDGSMGDC